MQQLLRTPKRRAPAALRVADAAAVMRRSARWGLSRDDAQATSRTCPACRRFPVSPVALPLLPAFPGTIPALSPPQPAATQLWLALPSTTLFPTLTLLVLMLMLMLMRALVLLECCSRARRRCAWRRRRPTRRNASRIRSALPDPQPDPPPDHHRPLLLSRSPRSPYAFPHPLNFEYTEKIYPPPR